MTVDRHCFGTLSDGSCVSLFTVSNGQMSFSVTDYGCTITSIVLNGKDDTAVDVCLGYSTLDGYVRGDVFFGAFVGRFANRIGGAKFALGGREYALDANDGKNTLHGGFDFWHKKVWQAKEVKDSHGSGVEFSRLSCRGEQGFPGNMAVKVLYLLGEDNSITMRYTAETDEDCPVNFTNHSYFNLAGKGDVLHHTLQMNCPMMLAVDSALIPTGEITPVKGTAYDFTAAKVLGKDISHALGGVGYDNCFVTAAYDGAKGLPLQGEGDGLVHVATLCDPSSKRAMAVETNMEGVQLYTGNFIARKIGKAGIAYPKHGGVCLETQCFPDSPNKNAFPPAVLKAGQHLNAMTVLRFSF